MDAIEFLKAFNRICNNHRETCMTCPLERESCDLTSKYCNHEKVVSIVEKWEKEYPTKTRQGEMLKLFPNLPDENLTRGFLNFCPKLFEGSFLPGICSQKDCLECQEKYWLEEIE